MPLHPATPPSPPCHFEGAIDIGPREPAGVVARFVRYPGCQQLQLWLPQPDHHGLRRVQVRRTDGLTVDDTWLHQRLSGSVQLLFDTLAWPPGAYRLTVDEAPGQPAVVVALHKAEAQSPAGANIDAARAATAESRAPTSTQVAEAPATAPTHPDAVRVYRDGLGRVIPDEAQQLRDTAWALLQRRFSRQVRVHNQGRGGTVTYEERLPQLRRIRFDHEIAAGPWHWVVSVPTPARWQAETGFALDERDEVLRHVAETLQRTQGPSWAWTLTEDAIAFHDAPALRR